MQSNKNKETNQEKFCPLIQEAELNLFHFVEIVLGHRNFDVDVITDLGSIWVKTGHARSRQIATSVSSLG